MMAVFVLSLVLLFALAGHSSAMYCLCKDGSSVAQLQKNIDFACGSGADCGAILQNGACFNPNTVKDHCNYAVNSYYQRQSQSGANCDFSGTATLSANPPAGSGSGSCVYQSTAGNTGGSTGTGNGTPTNPGIINNTPFGFGPGPTGVGINPDGSAAATRHKHFAVLFTITLVFSSLICLRD